MGATANHTPLAKKSSVRRLLSKLTSPSKKKIEKRAAKAHRKSLSTVLSTLPNNVENKEKHAETLKTVLSEPLLNTAAAKDVHRRSLARVNSTLPNSEANKAAHRDSLAPTLQAIRGETSRFRLLAGLFAVLSFLALLFR
jgi:hypothetical protein